MIDRTLCKLFEIKKDARLHISPDFWRKGASQVSRYESDRFRNIFSRENFGRPYEPDTLPIYHEDIELSEIYNMLQSFISNIRNTPEAVKANHHLQSLLRVLQNNLDPQIRYRRITHQGNF